MLLPSMLREALPDASIGFFLHIPFPDYETFRTLPWRDEIVRGVLGATSSASMPTTTCAISCPAADAWRASRTRAHAHG